MRRRTTKAQAVVLYAVMVTTWVTGCRKQPQSSPAVAVVGNDRLTVDDLFSEIPEEMQSVITREHIQEYVQRWVNSQLLLQEAKRRGLDRRVDLQRELRKLERELLVSQLLEEELDKQQLVNDEEVQKYYDENRESFYRDADEIHLFHLLLPTQEEADSVLFRLSKGESFEEVAATTQNSEAGEGNWDLGYVSAAELLPEITQRVFRRRPGSAPIAITSRFGVHVCKVVDRQPRGSIKTFEEVEDEIRIKLTAQKRQQRFQQLLSRLRSQTEIITDYQVVEQILASANGDSLRTNQSTQK